MTDNPKQLQSKICESDMGTIPEVPARGAPDRLPDIKGRAGPAAEPCLRPGPLPTHRTPGPPPHAAPGGFGAKPRASSSSCFSVHGPGNAQRGFPQPGTSSSHQPWGGGQG